MTRRPRQKTKGTTVKNRVGAARATTLCFWSIREKGQNPCWHVGLQGSRPGTPGNTRPRRDDANPNPRSFASGTLRPLAETVRTRHNCARKIVKPDVANPSVAPSDIWVCNVHFWQHQSFRLDGPVVSSCGYIRCRDHNSRPNPLFLASGPPHSLAEIRKKPPLLHSKNNAIPTVPTRR